MKWIEVIKLRTTGHNDNSLKTELVKLIEENEKNVKEQEIMAFSRVLIDTDYNVQIFHDTADVEMDGSSLGLRLVSALKAFGLVDHSIWVALGNKENEVP